LVLWCVGVWALLSERPWVRVRVEYVMLALCVAGLIEAQKMM
jgi:hypothetical protein